MLLLLSDEAPLLCRLAWDLGRSHKVEKEFSAQYTLLRKKLINLSKFLLDILLVLSRHNWNLICILFLLFYRVRLDEAYCESFENLVFGLC